MSKKEKCQVRIFPKKLRTPMEVNVYGTTSFIVIWKEDPREVTAIVFHDNEITQSFKQYGEILWTMAKQA